MAVFGWRRLVERGVRFVELVDTGSSNNWDSHGDMMDHERLAKNVDQPIAGLLTDLKIPRITGRHAGCLGDGIWSHAVQQYGRGERANITTGRLAPGWPAQA